MTLADRVVVMNAGRIEQVGTPNDLYHSPATRFVAGFIGSPAMNFLPCTLESARRVQLRLTVRDSPFPCRTRVSTVIVRTRRSAVLLFGLRPEHITDQRSSIERESARLRRRIDVIEPMGIDTLVHFRVNGTEVCGRVDPAAKAEPGGSMKLLADLDHMHLIDGESGRVL